MEVREYKESHGQNFTKEFLYRTVRHLGFFKGEVIERSRNAVIEKRSQSMVFVAEDVIEEPGTDVDVCCMECQKIVGSSARAA